MAYSKTSGRAVDRSPPGRALVELGMRKHVLLYGLLGGVLIAGLKLIEYRWLVVEHSLEIYGGLVAAVFAGLGIWLGLRLTRHTETVVVREVVVPAPVDFVRDEGKLESLGITPRELEILELIAAGAEQPGDRRAGVREREHGQDAFEPGVRQARRAAADPGGAAGQGAPADPLSRPNFRMISRGIDRNHPFG